MKTKTVILLTATVALLMASCIKDEAANTECDIESAWVEGWNLTKHFYDAADMRKDNISDTMAQFLNEVPQPFADQDAWNKFGIEQDKIVIAPVRFNECISCGFTADPAIVHYCAYSDWYENNRIPRRAYLDKYM